MTKEYGYFFEWNTSGNPEIPSIVVVEFRIYDMDVQYPGGWYEVGRLVKGVTYDEGYLEFTPNELSSLPLVPNAIDDFYELVGLWGEISISRHQFFKMPYEDDEVVVDVVHIIQSPIDLVE